MDPVTLALVAASVSGVTDGLVGSSAAEIYGALKARLSARSKEHGDIMRTVSIIEKQPNDTHQRAVLSRFVAESGAASDPEILQLAQQLLAALGKSGQLAAGSYIAQADHNSTASVNMYHDPYQKP